MKKSNEATAELSLDSLDNVVGGLAGWLVEQAGGPKWLQVGADFAQGVGQSLIGATPWGLAVNAGLGIIDTYHAYQEHGLGWSTAITAGTAVLGLVPGVRAIAEVNEAAHVARGATLGEAMRDSARDTAAGLFGEYMDGQKHDGDNANSGPPPGPTGHGADPDGTSDANNHSPDLNASDDQSVQDPHDQSVSDANERGAPETADHNAPLDVSPDRSSDYNDDYSYNDYKNEDYSSDGQGMSSGSYFGNDLGDSYFDGGDFGGGGFGGSDFA